MNEKDICPICNKEITEFDLFWFADFNSDEFPYYETKKICPECIQGIQIKTTDVETLQNTAWNY